MSLGVFRSSEILFFFPVFRVFRNFRDSCVLGVFSNVFESFYSGYPLVSRPVRRGFCTCRYCSCLVAGDNLDNFAGALVIVSTI